MPKRSNDFQKLVYLIKSHWGEANEIVESKELIDKTSGAIREVDVCISRNISGHKLIVSLECTAKSRKPDVTWVEQMYAKHSRLETNLLILYSKHGFTKEALHIAKIYGIRTVSLKQIEEGYITKLIGHSDDLMFGSYSLSASKVWTLVPKRDNLPEENIIVLPDNKVCDSTGQLKKSMRELVEDLLKSRNFISQLAIEAHRKHVAFEVVNRDFVDIDGEQVFLEKLYPSVLRRIVTLRIQGNFQLGLEPVLFQHGRLDKIDASWGRVSVQGQSAFVVVSPDEQGTPKISISFN